MNKLTKTFLLTLIITLNYGCQNSSEKVRATRNPVNPDEDSLALTDDKSRFRGLDPETALYFDNEIRDLHKFDINYHFPEFDDKYKKLKSDPKTQIIPEKEEVCRGDACQTLKTFRLDDELIKISKFDCGEYGFSNYQYYFKDSVIILYRHYSVSVAKFTEDDKPTIWEVKDLQYIISGEEVILRKKIRLTEGLKLDYSLKNDKAKVIRMERSEVEIAAPELHEEL